MNFRLCFLTLFLFTYLFGCSSSEESYHQYAPEYTGKFVNSEEKLQAWYKIPDEYYHKNDSNFHSYFFGGYYLADNSDQISNRDTTAFLIKPNPNIEIILKQARYRMIVDHESKFAKGMKVNIHNNSDDTLILGVQDGSMYMIQEALDPNGNWEPIEYWVNSWCGNSYGNIYFPPHTSIYVGAYRYQGTFSTKLRFKFKYFNEKIVNGVRNKKFIYSEPFEGSVNYSQFHKMKAEPFRSYLE